ncbi:hypothetical protein [Gloeobacter kilaueensis]|uniref:Uncharacterized protein n=1 Tax=Gloeobacter kilaueensis (strain ATCC BAA-2537 / CCAP 1431/1 / ULC 316 / JS1) TaxID=1183438 RepID=U5QR56_GLOK1|nr:hypothetical protein [Gloeobacter kilaueensis]AGY60205.1 hypothetical protein GKIL_3959 [Gloeobacter kilaueensis JS1]
MHLATLSVVALAGLAVFSVGNATVRLGKTLPKACFELAVLAVLTVFWFALFHVLNS